MSGVRIPLPALLELPRGNVFRALTRAESGGAVAGVSPTEETQPHVPAERCRKSMGIVRDGISLGVGSSALRRFTSSKRGVSGEQGYRGNILYGVCVCI